LTLLTLALAICALATPLLAQEHVSGTAGGEWRYWGGDERSSRYSPVDQINAENFGELEVAWRWTQANYGPTVDYIYRSTPIYVNGKLYTVAGQRRTVVSIDPATGETLWMWRPKPNPRWEDTTRKNYGKGVAYANVGGRDTIFAITAGYYMVALDAETGLPIPYFGMNGIVDLQTGLGYPVHPDRGTIDYGDITSSAPPIIVNGVIVVGNSHKQGYRPKKISNIPGHVRGYDAKTGEMLWIFHVVPQPGEPGHETWENDSWKYTGNISSWPPLSADSERGLVFIPTDTPTNDYYGGDRPGDNLYGTSLIALDVKTGKKAWHFQMVHHDIWNYDNPIAPKVLDVDIDGKPTPIVAQGTKQGWVYVFNRETGEPIWPIEERPVPQSDIPTEKTSPTQPHVTWPPPFEQQGMTEDDLVDFTPELKAEAIEVASKHRMGPLFNPPSLVDNADGTSGTFFVPGAWGGANIPGGASIDPETGIMYIATVRLGGVLTIEPGENQGSEAGYVQTQGFSRTLVSGLPIVKPPYSSIVAIDLNTGEHVFQIPNGDTPENIKNNPALEGVDIPRTGKIFAHATVLTTKSLLIYGEGRSGAPLLHAVDKATGEELAEIELPGPTNTAPMTYVHEGRQYIVVSIGGRGVIGEHVALALPED
jgi:quinoprotein glucose dehydrogenase